MSNEIKIGVFTGNDSNFFKSNRALENGSLVNAEKLAEDLLKSKKVYVKPHRAGAHQVKGFYRTDTRGKKGDEGKGSKAEGESKQMSYSEASELLGLTTPKSPGEQAALAKQALSHMEEAEKKDPKGKSVPLKYKVAAQVLIDAAKEDEEASSGSFKVGDKVKTKTDSDIPVSKRFKGEGEVVGKRTERFASGDQVYLKIKTPEGTEEIPERFVDKAEGKKGAEKPKENFAGYETKEGALQAYDSNEKYIKKLGDKLDTAYANEESNSVKNRIRSEIQRIQKDQDAIEAALVKDEKKEAGEKPKGKNHPFGDAKISAEMEEAIREMKSSDNLTKFRKEVEEYRMDAGISRDEAERDVILYNLQDAANNETISWTELESLQKKYGEAPVKGKEKMKSSHKKFWEKMKQGAYMKKNKEKMGDNPPPPSSSAPTPVTGVRG